MLVKFTLVLLVGVGSSSSKEDNFFRVNYEPEHWEILAAILLEDHTLIHELNRARLVDDAFNIACAQFRIDPWCGLNPVYFQFRNSMTGKIVKWVYENYYILGLYGGAGFTHNSAWEMSCKLLGQYHANMGLTHEYKWHNLVKQKHAGQQKQLIRWN